MKRQIKKTIVILLAVCFVLSITAAAVSADQAEYDRGYKDGNDAGYKAGIQNCKQDQPLTPQHDTRGGIQSAQAGGSGSTQSAPIQATTSDYDRGYQIGYNAGFQNGYNACGSNPVADFSASPTSGKAPLQVNFIDQSTENPVKWKWDFGDGQTSIDQNPTHTYASAGTYTVKLIVQNKTGSDSITKFNSIKARP